MTLSKFLNLGIHFDTAPILLGEQQVQPHIAGDPAGKCRDSYIYTCFFFKGAFPTTLLCTRVQSRHMNFQFDLSFLPSEDGAFFDHWDFISSDDPTHGFVDYVTKEVALKEELIRDEPGGNFIGGAEIEWRSWRLEVI